MVRIHDVRLELVRPGPPHNQLLSPLTPYTALCGDGSPITFHIDFEHQKLLNRLEALRYDVPEWQRQAQVSELGEELGRILERIPSLNAELSRAAGHDSSGANAFVHLRLVLSGSELAILPLELARAPQSFPGEGLDLCLQGNLPVVITREVRRSRPLPASWCDRTPKILFVSAEPRGLTVPKLSHIRALRAALIPWIERPTQDDSLDAVKDHLRVLPNASIEAIYEHCARESFTHVHVLAHGATYERAGERRFGVALCRGSRPERQHVVDGAALAKALRAQDHSGVSRSSPLMVTLATCDSGQQSSVIVPGGSIAHDLHAAGIPWVLASQFPLTKAGSVRLTEFIYPRLLSGDDPRRVLFEARRKLSMSASNEHDWASLVAYATIPSDLPHQVEQFFETQTIRAINVLMGRADRLAAAVAPSEVEDELAEALTEVNRLLETWEERIPDGESLRDRTARAKCFGIQGSTLKRMGLLRASMNKQRDAVRTLHKALVAYRHAMNEWVTEESRFNWTASQYLALRAVLDDEIDSETYTVCRRLALRDLENRDPEIKAWAHGTLAELALLSLAADADPAEVAAVERQVTLSCKALVSIMGTDSFHAASTARQFSRYADRWNLDDWERHDWERIAKEAVEILDPDRMTRRPRENGTPPSARGRRTPGRVGGGNPEKSAEAGG